MIFLVIGFIVIYYMYRYLYTSSSDKLIPILTQKRAADSAPDNLPKIPTPYEGGEYSVNIWIYVNSYNKNLNTRKHIFELQGDYFSSLLVGLGAFNNTLMVRTHTQNPSAEGFQSGFGSGKGYKLIEATDGFQSGAGSGSGSGSGMTNASAPRPSATPTASAVPPNASGNIGNLSVGVVKTLFTPLAMNDSLLTSPPTCDLPEVDLQRWTLITVVLNGRTIDVYLDGKLRRSCMASSYFRVDPTGVRANITDFGGFDGYTGYTAVANYAMNPDEIYRAYLSGPNGLSSTDIFSWFISLFKGSS
ncbi:hypothetical protein EBR66_03275 [bacterium]|nr:hypothetical protein [bacterium]